MTSEEQKFLDELQRRRHWEELMKGINKLRDDEVKIVAAYVNRFIESRPKQEKSRER